MVTILPPKTNVGTQIGQALGQGFQGGVQSGLGEALQRIRQNYQAQKLSETFKELEGQTDPVAVAKALSKASIFSPAADRTLSSLGQYLIGQGRVGQLYGQEERQGKEPLPPAQAYQDALKFVEGQEPSGFLREPLNSDQIQAFGERYAQVLGKPEAYREGIQQANDINQQRMQSKQALVDRARAQGIQENEIPRFLQSATDFQHLNNLQSIERAAIDKTLQIRNQKDALKNINVPGAYQKLGGIKQHFVPGMTLFKALTSKGEARQKALKGYDELIKNLVNQGEEPYVRETLSGLGLSPTEVEERIHPITPSISKQINSLPKANQLTPKIRQEKLVDFFKDNVTNDTSLLVLRHYLMEDKNYSWEDVQNAVKQAFPNADSLNKYQAAEIAALARPPLQSLSQIFGSTPDVRGFLRGQR